MHAYVFTEHSPDSNLITTRKLWDFTVYDYAMITSLQYVIK